MSNSQRVNRERMRSRDRRRCQSFFVVESIQVGDEELLAGAVPVDVLEEIGRSPAMPSLLVGPGKPIRMRVTRPPTAFARRFVASAWIASLGDLRQWVLGFNYDRDVRGGDRADVEAESSKHGPLLRFVFPRERYEEPDRRRLPSRSRRAV